MGAPACAHTRSLDLFLFGLFRFGPRYSDLVCSDLVCLFKSNICSILVCSYLVCLFKSKICSILVCSDLVCLFKSKIYSILVYSYSVCSNFVCSPRESQSVDTRNSFSRLAKLSIWPQISVPRRPNQSLSAFTYGSSNCKRYFSFLIFRKSFIFIKLNVISQNFRVTPLSLLY